MILKNHIAILILLILIFFVSPCLAGSNAKNAMLQMTATIENGETHLQWNYAENVHDDRGITFGIIGFCTGTYDGNILLKYYTTLNPDNALEKYIPALNTIDAGPHNEADGDGNPSVTGLTNFATDIQKCHDPLFKQAQLYELDQLYYNPAVTMFNRIGAKNSLTLAFIYDMCVRHGNDGTQSIIYAATSALGGTPKTGINENTYLLKLISLRDAQLRREKLGDVDRDTGFKNILKSGNVNLTTPFTFVACGDSFTITGDLGIDIRGSSIGSAPVASFSGRSTNGKAPLKVSFTDKSTGSPISWKWSFGDGTYSTAKNPVHKYSKAGKYTVSLTVKNVKGINTVKKSRYIKVS
jgi:chitosanase